MTYPRSHSGKFIAFAIAAGLALVTTGCTKDETASVQAAAQTAAPPQVSVAQVVNRDITEFDEFAGRVEAVERVEIRPRVSGYISSVEFEEGNEVAKGDVLFVIDPRPYEAELKRAKAELSRAVSARALSKSEHQRAIKLLDLHAISQEEFDSRSAGREQADANVQAAQAAVDTAELNLTFTRVRAPIAGRIGRAEITAGNLVTSGSGAPRLTTLVSTDPVYVEFQSDEQVYLKYADLARRGERAGARDPGQPVWVGLADEQGYPHQGELVFLDNTLDSATGTIRARGRLDNRERLFTPGMFARVKLTGSGRYNALLIKDSAVGTDQSVKYVLVVSANNTLEYRAVKLGPMVDGLRVVREGLSSGERIVVNGLQRVRPGASVSPELVAMETSKSAGPLVARSASALR